MACDEQPDFFLDQKWRITKDPHHQHYLSSDQTSPSLNPNSSSTTFTRSRSHKHQRHTTSKPSSSSSSSSLSKSSSVRISRRSATSPPAPLRRSSSTSHRHPPDDDEKSPPLLRSISRKGSSFTRKCTSIAKEQKARFYIIRRCVSMLVRWSKHRDS